MSCGVGGRRGLNLALLWLWHRPASVAPNRPLSWEPPYTLSAALKRKKDPKKSYLFIGVKQFPSAIPYCFHYNQEKKNHLISISQIHLHYFVLLVLYSFTIQPFKLKRLTNTFMICIPL